MPAVEIQKDLFWVGALDPDLRIFDIVMKTEYGTSYNSYLLKTTEGNILFETAKIKFFDDFLKNIKSISKVEDIKFIVINHTEPDHSGSLEKLVDIIPNVKVVASVTAHSFLREICNKELPELIVLDGNELKLGNKTLSFISVPFLHWPDSIYTYVNETKTLVTCDSFGCHYADPKICNDLIDGDFIDAYKYYFNMIMGPFKQHIRYALEKISDLDINTICPGHGPVLRVDVDKYIALYDKWSYENKETKDKPFIVNAYVSAYGHTAELAAEIVSGIKETISEASIESFDLVATPLKKVIDKIKRSTGFLLGTPTINGDALPPIHNVAMALNGIVDGGKIAASYGSYGWSGEGPLMINDRLNAIRMETLEPPLTVNFKPSKQNREEARAFGRRFGKKVKEQWELLSKNNSTGKTYWKCTVCGEVFEGPLPPAKCPVCGVTAEAFVPYKEDIVDNAVSTNRKFVIIGGGAAAISAAEAIRKRDTSAYIDIYSEEKYLPYYRPQLTEIISNDVKNDMFYTNSEVFYKDKKIRIHLNSRVLKVDRASKKIEISDGKRIAYDKLLIATGASPFIPPINGCKSENIFTLRTLDELNLLKEKLSTLDNKTVTIIGGGLLGLETAFALSKTENTKVNVIDTAKTILPHQTDSKGGEIISRIVMSSSINVTTNAMVEEIGCKGKKKVVKLNDGTYFESDIVIVSVGILPNISLAKDASLKCERAIVVDKNLKTSDEDIFAAGDCSAVNGRYYGIWDPAVEQGKVAGANMCGETKEFEERSYPVTLNAFDTSLFFMGEVTEESTTNKLTLLNDLENRYTALYFRENILVGAISIGSKINTPGIITAINSGLTYNECKDNKVFNF